MPLYDTLPKEITKDIDNNMHCASFDYYTGIAEAKRRNLEQTTDFAKVFNNTHFIVCCGDVMIRVNENEYPEMNRRII